jgi:hypothetical protein
VFTSLERVKLSAFEGSQRPVEVLEIGRDQLFGL